MRAFQSLLNIALAGTQRQQPAVPGAAGATQQLLSQIVASAAPPQTQLLQMAGVLAACGKTRFEAPVHESSQPPTPAAPEQLGTPDRQFTEAFLRPLIGEGPLRLQQEAFSTLAQAKLRLPASALPAALELGRRTAAVRASLALVLGTRGMWLASLNPIWSFATGARAEAPDEEMWETGSTEQRHAAFLNLRAKNAIRAREKLAAELPQCSARERAELVALLGSHLAESDEALLDSLLGDRSKDVRQTAASLLTRLPASRHAQAVIAFLQPLLRQESGFFGSPWVIDAPAATVPEWKTEALDTVRPAQESLGDRAWWLYHLVRQIPLPWWIAHCQLQPDELLKWSGKSEWKEALQRGWCDAYLAAPHAAWGEALLEHGDTKMVGRNASSLLALLPLPQREKHWARMIAGAKRGELAQLLSAILAGCPTGTISLELSVKVAAAIAEQLKTEPQNLDYSLRYELPDALCVLHTDALNSLKAALATQAAAQDASPSHSAFFHSLQRIVAARQAIAALPLSPVAA